MRTVIPLLQLLALCHQAAASVCRPRVTSSSVSIESVATSASTAASSTVSSTGSVSTTRSSTETASSSTETVSLSTTETASSGTETVSLSTTETASSFTESASLSTTESATISTTETASSSTETASLSTTDSSTVVSTTSSASESISADSSTITSSTFFTSTTSTTSTAEASSTTSSVPEGPPELLDNRDFENKDSLSPWVPYQTFETVAISTDVFHQGEQSARVTWTSPVTPFGQYNYYIGIRQPVSASKLLADTPYEFSVWIKMAPGIRCDNFGIACTVATGYTPASYKAVPLPGSGDWEQAKTTCQWTQAGLNLGPGVRVFGYCREAEYYVDDASLKQIV